MWPDHQACNYYCTAVTPTAPTGVFAFMSVLSQLAANSKVAAATAATAAAAAPLTQPQDDASSDIDLNALAPAPCPSRSDSSCACPANAHHHSNNNSHDASPCSPCLSSTPPPFVAPDMLDTVTPTSASFAVMPRHEQEQCREQLIRTPGLYACWRMQTVTMYSSNGRNKFHEHLLAGRVVRFELVSAYVGLCRQVSCLYTILECEIALREAPLQVPHVRFREDGQVLEVLQLDDHEDASAWSVMHRHFHLQFIPFLLVGKTKSVEQARLA
jgi:hypothetical protein